MVELTKKNVPLVISHLYRSQKLDDVSIDFLFDIITSYIIIPFVFDLFDEEMSKKSLITNDHYFIENTKKCAEKNGLDWEMASNYTFLKQCMRERGWIPSNCCAFTKDCSCK